MIRELRVWRREVPSSGEDERPGVQAKRIRRVRACVVCVVCVLVCNGESMAVYKNQC